MAMVELPVTNADLERLKARALADYGRADKDALSQVLEDGLKWGLDTLERRPPLIVKYEGSPERWPTGSGASPEEIDTWGKIYNILKGGRQ